MRPAEALYDFNYLICAMMRSEASVLRPLPLIRWNAYSAWLILVALGCRQAPQADQTRAVSFGRRQVDQMLADRPDMANVLSDNDPIVLWVIAGFNGERMGERVYWNASSPRSGQPGEHWRSYLDYPPHIRLSGGTETTPVDRWTALIYEFFNMENDKSFEALENKANAGEIDRDAYAAECAGLEFAAHKKTKEFLRQQKLPRSQHGNDPYFNWVLSSPDTAETYFKILQQSRGYNPINYYQNYYDANIVRPNGSSP